MKKIPGPGHTQPTLCLGSHRMGTTAAYQVSLHYIYYAVAQVMVSGNRRPLFSWATLLEVLVCALAGLVLHPKYLESEFTEKQQHAKVVAG